jgi:hypothetical protein
MKDWLIVALKYILDKILGPSIAELYREGLTSAWDYKGFRRGLESAGFDVSKLEKL